MKPKSCARPDDKLQAMLDALDDDIDHRPAILRPVPADLVAHIRGLMAGIEVELRRPLPPERGDTGTP